MPKKQNHQNLKKIEGVEVFSSGEWNGEKYTNSDLDEMVRAFQETSKTFRPPLKLGHSTDQTLLQQDGLPAAGWIGDLRREGSKLVADFIDIPEKIFKLLENKIYRNVSSEIWWNAKVGDSKYSRLLSGVALLGADMPAVSNLEDILNFFGLDASSQIKSYAKPDNDSIVKTYSLTEEREMSEALKLKYEHEKETREKAEKKLNSLEAEIKKRDAEFDEFKKKFSVLETEKKTLAEQAKEQADKAETERKKNFISELKDVTKSMHPYVDALIETEGKKEFSHGEKKFSREDALKELLKLHKNAILDINTEETTTEGEKKTDHSADEAKITKYMADHDCAYSVAYREVLKDRV